jgi:DNA-binding NtrC family response regulator/tetratricopeptide (TPR) repeat protein
MAVDTLNEIGRLIEEGCHEQALSELERMSGIDPSPTNWTYSVQGATSGQLVPGRIGQLHSLAGTLLDNLANRDKKPDQARLHGLLGYLSLRLGAVHKAESHLRAAIHILSWDLGDIPGSIRQQRRLSVLLKNLGLYHQARFECERVIALADEHGLERESQASRQNIAIVLIKMGRLHDAQEVLDGLEERLNKHIEKPADTRALPRFHLLRANFLRIRGQAERAVELLVPALRVVREQMLSREEAIALEYMGDCYLAQREFKRALEQYELALKIAEATAPEGDIIPELCHRMGEAKVRLGDPNAAIVLCERGLRMARASNDRYEECATHRVYAMAHRAAGNSKKALRIADEGIDLGRRYEIPYELGRTLAWAGEVRVEDSSPDEQAHGRRLLWEARGILERMGLSQWVNSIDRLLGFDSGQGNSTEGSVLSEIESLGDLDRGALRFGIVTRNAKIREAVEVLQSVAPSQIPVLITGESGVGKELLAQALHQMSPRRKGPFVPVNCGAISVNLLNSEFFGHERGAFTGAITSREGLLASSDKGTLFLDEVGDLPLQVQAALLRVLETGEIRAVGRDDVRKVDIRIVAATNAALEDLVSRSAFRQDLFYRLNGVRIPVPPLRDREEDIRALFRYFWAQACASAKKRLEVDDTVESLLGAYDWPGNVRELRHEIARVVALSADGTAVGPDAFLIQLKRRDVGSLRRDRDMREEVSEERREILLALRAHRGNKAEAARSLGGMKRTTLIYKIERLGIRPEEYEAKG